MGFFIHALVFGFTSLREIQGLMHPRPVVTLRIGCVWASMFDADEVFTIAATGRRM